MLFFCILWKLYILSVTLPLNLGYQRHTIKSVVFVRPNVKNRIKYSRKASHDSSFENKVDLWLDMRNIIPGEPGTVVLRRLYDEVSNKISDKNILKAAGAPIKALLFHETNIPPDADGLELPKYVATNQNELLEFHSSKNIGFLKRADEIALKMSLYKEFLAPDNFLVLDRARSEDEWVQAMQLADVLLPLSQDTNAQVVFKASTTKEVLQCFLKFWEDGEHKPFMLENAIIDAECKSRMNIILISPDAELWEMALLHCLLL